MKLADVFQNGAVLQQKKPIVVWGTDDNGRYVKAVLSGEEPREARAEIKDGKFVQYLRADAGTERGPPCA